MAKRDFARRAAAERLRTNGAADVADMTWNHRPPPPIKRQSKAAIREESARLMEEYLAKKSKTPPRQGRDGA